MRDEPTWAHVKPWWLIVALVLLAAPVVWAETVVWDGSLEANPDNNDLASLIDDFIRETRIGTRERGDAEHAWDNIDAGGGPVEDVTQSGRHREGSARVFFQAAKPSTLLGVDADASSALDSGRIWIDSDAGNALNVYDPAAVDFERVGVALPTFAIILWDQATGDLNCDGVAGNNECPCGFTEAAEFRMFLPRGADRAAANADIPDVPGSTCDPAALGAGCGAGAAVEYDDTLDTAEMPAHTHTVTVPNGTDDSSAGPLLADTADNTPAGTNLDVFNTGSTGGATTHYHPFRTVLFCRAS